MTKTTRAAIIRKAKECLEESKFQFNGICGLMQYTIANYFNPGTVRCTLEMNRIFPKFDFFQAMEITKSDLLYPYWWPKRDWSGGRMQFFNWLYEQYKDDETEVEL